MLLSIHSTEFRRIIRCFNVESSGYNYAAEDAAQIVNVVTKIMNSIFVQANLVANVKDVIDPALYPVNATTGLPLADNDRIRLYGSKANAGANDAEVSRCGGWPLFYEADRPQTQNVTHIGQKLKEALDSHGKNR